MSKLQIEQVDRVEEAEVLTLGDLKLEECFVFMDCGDTGVHLALPCIMGYPPPSYTYLDDGVYKNVDDRHKALPVRRITAKLTWSYED